MVFTLVKDSDVNYTGWEPAIRVVLFWPFSPILLIKIQLKLQKKEVIAKQLFSTRKGAVQHPFGSQNIQQL